MVHGQLLDPHGEFFIRQCQGSSGSTASVPDVSFQWEGSFELDPAQLSPCISPETAESIIFIGKALLLLRHPRGEFAGRVLLAHQDTLQAAQALRELQEAPTFERSAFERCVGALKAKTAALLWQLVVQQAGLLSHLAALKDYFLLAKGEFAHAFLVEAKRLMSLPPRPQGADSDVGVPWQQAALGSSAQYDPLFPLFRIRWAPSEATYQVNLPPHARLPGAVHVPSFDSSWDGLWLEAGVEWPLGLLLTPPVMARYNALFQLLLRLRRVQLSLEGAWSGLGELGDAARAAVPRGRRVPPQPRDVVLVQLQQLRHHMVHMVSNLQIYIQVDVIESNYAQLEARVVAAQDFVAVERAHAEYLHTLMAQCFLTTHTISGIITSIFKHVGELCRQVDALKAEASTAILRAAGGAMGAQTATAAGDAARRGSAAERVAKLATGFQQHCGELYMVLHSSRLLDANKAPHLRQLYMRLNFNGYMRAKMVSSVLTEF